MDSFVTRIGDVTIERVAPKVTPPQGKTESLSSSPTLSPHPNDEASDTPSKREVVKARHSFSPSLQEDSKSKLPQEESTVANADDNIDAVKEAGLLKIISGDRNSKDHLTEKSDLKFNPKRVRVDKASDEDDDELDDEELDEEEEDEDEELEEEDEDDDDEIEENELIRDKLRFPLPFPFINEKSPKDSSGICGKESASDLENTPKGEIKVENASEEKCASDEKSASESKDVNGVDTLADSKKDLSLSENTECKKGKSNKDVKADEPLDYDQKAKKRKKVVKKKEGKKKSDRNEDSVGKEGEATTEGEAKGNIKPKRKPKTRQKRKVVVADDSERSEEGGKKKRKRKKMKGSKEEDSKTSGSSESENEDSGKKKKQKKKPTKKGKKKDEDDEDSESEKAERKTSNMRRNIREVMDETQLDEATLSAQRQEMERLKRVQEQQRILREMAQQRQQQKTESRVMSLLQGNTSILKQVSIGASSAQSQSSTSSTKPNTVVVKLGSGAGAQNNKRVLDLLRGPQGAAEEESLTPSVTRTLVNKPRVFQGTTMMTPSVSIAPVRSSPGTPPTRPGFSKPSSMMQAQVSFSGSEGEDDYDDDEDMLDDLEEGKKRKKDVVTISSSSSSEDDCIVLSEPSDVGEDEDIDDPTNSGMHTNDIYNVPDDEGRVQVNMGKPDGDPDIFLAPHLAKVIKPHQIGGIRFLYDNIIESIERFATSTGFGCILAHSMGLGKTLQVITFCDIFLRHTPAKTVLCIMPINTLQNWLAEFNSWLPEDPTNSPLAAYGEVRPRNFGLFVLNDSHKTLKARAKVVEDWMTKGGVLLIGYEMYRQLSLKKMSKPKKSRSKRKTVSDEEGLDPEQEEKRQKEILERVHEALVKPGPDLVICDEGHRIKNSHASISMALKQIRSKRRVVLTGYPLQNNLLEYWCMVDFVRPNYLGTKTEFCNMFERPIQNGQCIDSTPQDIRLMRYRAHVLHSLLEGFVQRRSHAVLQSALPQKEEYVLLVRMTPFQRKLYDTFMNDVVRTKAVPNPLKAFAVCCKIWNHPDVLYQFLKKREGGEGVDLDLEEAAAALAANTVADSTGTVVEERRTAPPKSRSKPRSNKSRKKASPKAAAAAAAAAGASSTPNNPNEPPSPFNLANQYPMHNQMNQNSAMGSYNQYNTHNQTQYPGSFGSVPHHYNPSNPYGHSNYDSNSGFNSTGSSINLSNQGSFPGSNTTNYGDSNISNSSSSQPMFPSVGSSNTSSTPNQDYGNMGSSFFNDNSPSSQHALSDNFGTPANYNQSWNSSENYNSFGQGQQPPPSSFPDQTYNSTNQNAPFDGYTPGASNNSSFNPSIYSGSESSNGNSSSAPYQQGIMGQQPMLGQNVMQPSNRPSHSMNQNMIPQESPVNASGMLPGGAPTKTPGMLNSSLIGSGMGMGMSNMTDAMVGHHQNVGMPGNMYQSSSMMGLPGQSQSRAEPGPMAALASMASSDMPPSADDLLRTADDFGPFNPPASNAMDNVKKSEEMYDMKDRSFFNPWTNSHHHSQGYGVSNRQSLKPPDSAFSKNKSESDLKYPVSAMAVNQLKREMGDVKLEDRFGSKVEIDNVQKSIKNELQDKKERDMWKVNSMEIADKDKDILEGEDKDKESKDDDEPLLGPDGKPFNEIPVVGKISGREDPGIPYDWAVELMKDYVPGLIENSAKMELFFCILEKSLALGDRILLFSQSLFTLSLIEEYLQRSYIPIPGLYERWQRNKTYYRLDGSTAALEREKLINEFNANSNVHLFLVSTRAGSLGINLVGANRVIVFDASWNPCHDTQAVCRVYRYGQKKQCFVYRFVMDNCLEKKIYDRQINKQGMSDRVVDECNPDAHLSIKEVTNLCWDDEKDTEVKDFSNEKDKHDDIVMQQILEKHGKLLSKAPFQHESLLVDRKDKKLSQAEKRLAKRSYEMEKRANNRPVYNYFNANQPGLQIRAVQRDAAGNIIKPVASVRPMQSELNSQIDRSGQRNTKWIPAEVWQRQGMSAQEMTLPLDVVIPTNSPERTSIVLKAGQRVMVLKSPKGIYMQLENGKIIAIRTAFKMGANKTENKPFTSDKDELKKGVMNKPNVKLSSGIHPLRNNPNITITPRSAPGMVRSGIRPVMQRPLNTRMPNPINMRPNPWVRPGGVAGRAVQLRPGQTLRPGIRGLSPSVTVTPTTSKIRNLNPLSIAQRPVPNASQALGLKPMEKESGKVKDLPDMRESNKLSSFDKDSSRLSSDDSQSNSSMHGVDVSFSSSALKVPSNTKKDVTASWSVGDKISKLIDKDSAKNRIGRRRSEDQDSQSSEDPAEFSQPVREMAMLASRENNSLDSSSTDSALLTSNRFSDNKRHPAANQRRHNQSKESSSASEIANDISSAASPVEASQSFSSGSMFNDYKPSSQSGVSGFASAGYHGASASSDQRGSKKEVYPPRYGYDGDVASNSHDISTNQWKSPPAFSPGVPAGKRNLGSPAYDDNSNASSHSNISGKSSNTPVVEPRGASDGLLYGRYDTSDSKIQHSKTSSRTQANVTSSQSSGPDPPSTSKSTTSPSVSSTTPNFDPYGNIYGGYGSYPSGLPSSNYYNPYSYGPGFLSENKSSLGNKSATESNLPSESSTGRPNPKSSGSRSESKKSSHDSTRSSRVDVSLPTTYDNRQAALGNSTAGSSASSSTATAGASDPAYNPIMMSPSFNPATCQYPVPPAASNSANPFSAAAANYSSPYASPYGYPGGYPESDLARASMYSAFHRPDPGQYPPAGPLDPASPYLPLPSHSAPPPSSGFYPQNMYGGQYGGARDPYGQIPYPSNPFMLPHSPYGGLSTPSAATPASDQAPTQ